MADTIKTYCALCTSRCGATATVSDGRLVALDPDPTHPTGSAICFKGKVAPELVEHPDRLRYPMRRTSPKGADPTWERIGWDEALDLIANRLSSLAEEHGPETVAFTNTSPSTSALVDSVGWIGRLRRAFGSPNYNLSMELCGWGRFLASQYVFGAAVPGQYMPDLERAGCVLYWGYNPSVSRLAHATATVAAVKRGAKMIVVDPRRVGMASRADHWLQVRPGTDGALALGLAGVLIANDWYDHDFVSRWTNGPLLVRSDTGRLLRWSDVDSTSNADDGSLATWDRATGSVTAYHPADGEYRGDVALRGSFLVATTDGGNVECSPVFETLAALCQEFSPDHVEQLTGVAADDVVTTARTLSESGPVAFYSWSGVEQQSGATQIARAINVLYALTGDIDAPGGNVAFGAIPSVSPEAGNLLAASQQAKALGIEDNPLGIARFGHVTSASLYRAMLDGDPYRVRGLVSFGSNLLVSHAEGATGREALAKLDFHVHADLFLNPTAELADIVLPVASPFETDGLKLGFEISPDAQALAQFRHRLVDPVGESRSDVDIVFDLAVRLGLGDRFWDGDVDEAYRAQLAPSGVTLEQLMAEPGGVRVETETIYRKYAESTGDSGSARGFRTPSGKVEFYSETLLDAGFPALPTYEPPLVGPETRPDLMADYPLILTCAKDANYLETQHRGLPSLRRQLPDPTVELHPDDATSRNIKAGDWVSIETPNGSARARAVLVPSLRPGVVSGQHGWWQGTADGALDGYPVLGQGSANYNALIGHDAVDPLGGSVPLRAYLCEVKATS